MTDELKSVVEFLTALPEERRTEVQTIRNVVLENLPLGYVETIRFGMLTYEVPLAVEPKTYNGKPLMYAAIASQKNKISIHLQSLYCVPGAEENFRKNWKGKKLDMGKACVRATSVAQLDLELIGKVIAATPPVEFVKYARK